MESDPKIVELLRTMPAFADLDHQVLSQIGALANLISVPEGTLIFAEGDSHTDLSFVLRGTVVLDMVTAQCGKQQILTLGEGDLLAWSTFLGDSRMTSSAVAATDTELVSFPAKQLRSLCEANHDVGYAVSLTIAKLMSRRLLATRLQLLDVFHL